MEKPQNKSWVELLDSSNSGFDDSNSRLSIPEIIVDSFDGNTSKSPRELKIAFNDSENEKKFDKLVTEKKIKSPFKRHLSNESLETSNAVNIELGKRCKMETEESPSKRARTDSTGTSSTNSGSFANIFKQREHEKDLEILDRRQKQINYGKNTIGYDNYIKMIPKDQRTSEHPKTPPRHLKYSRRAWEGLVKSWRKKLHAFDPKAETDQA